MATRRSVKLQKITDAKGAADASAFCPPSAKSNFDEGAFQLGLKDYAAARHKLGLALQEDPKNAKAHYYLGYCECMLGNTAASCNCFNRAIELGFDDPKVHSNLGLSFLLTGNCLGAVDEFSRAINRGTDNIPLALISRGFAYARLAWPYSTRYLKSGKKKDPQDSFYSNFYGRMAHEDVQRLRAIKSFLSPEMQNRANKLSTLVSYSVAGADSKKAEHARALEAKRISRL